MKNVQTPQLLTDLYRDLRDRRLLVPALVLVVALIAVPVALSSSSATTAPPAPAPATTAGGPEGEVATSPAVLTEELGLTDYRKRLEQLQSKNPFRQQFALPEVTSKVQESSVTAPVTTGVTTSEGGSTSTAGTTSTPSAPPQTTTTSPSSEPTDEPPEPTLYAFHADLAIGPPGDLTRRKSVELGKFQPGEAKPMVVFAGATEDLKHGLFLVSADVSSVTGDGRCVPGPNNCSLLRLKIGEEAKLAYGPEGDRTYKLRLNGIHLAPIAAKAAGKRGKHKNGGERSSLFALAAQG